MDNDRYYQLGSYDKLFNQIDELTDALASRDAEIAELKKDAVRYQLVREYMVSERTDVDDEFVSACSTNEPEKLDAFVDYVLAQ